MTWQDHVHTWLLAEDTPAVRAATLQRLLVMPPHAAQGAPSPPRGVGRDRLSGSCASQRVRTIWPCHGRLRYRLLAASARMGPTLPTWSKAIALPGMPNSLAVAMPPRDADAIGRPLSSRTHPPP
jgi:hypothetical protein